jgi:outer membrane receptor protein involved in Fe transport
MNITPSTKKLYALLSSLLAVPLAGQAVRPDTTTRTTDEESVFVLSPFEVSAEAERGYSAATTLAGNRLNTELRDVGNAIQVVTSQFLRDTGAVNNETLLQYTTGTEVGNVFGNFAGLGDGAQLDETDRFRNPNQNTRVRGLTSADNTRDYFLTDIPWDGYNIDRVDLSRGPNSILFGQGSPAGIINAGTKPAMFRNAGEVEFRLGSHGTTRGSFDVNQVLLRDELAIRVNALREHEKFRQDPAYELDKRLSASLRYEPRFLKRGTARTILRANFEIGDIDSNRPRTLPPGDYITPWFETGTYEGTHTRSGALIPGTDPQGRTQVQAGDVRTFPALNRMTTNPHMAQNDNFYRPEFPHGLTRPSINGGPFGGYANPYFNPWAGAFAAYIGGPLAYYGDGGAGNPTYISQEIREDWGISPTGAIDRSLAFDFNRLVGIAPYANFAINAGLPLAEFGVYKNRSLTDPSIYNFYRQLIDGPNKREWQDFDVFNISLSQTFMNDKFGFDLTYNREDYRNGQVSLLSGQEQGLYIDINRVYTDGTIPGRNGVPFDDGTPNPNLGRPFISDNGANGNNSYKSERESKRITAFITHDFAQNGRSANWLARILGQHTLTGLWAEDEQNTDNRSWMRYAVLDGNYRNFIRSTANFNEGQTFVPSQVIYLGPSLMNATTAAGANIPRAQHQTQLPSGTTRVFSSHWRGHNVNPAAEWLNTMYPADQTAQYVSTQSENPANYEGWINYPLNITDAEESAANRNLLTTSATLRRKLTTSKVLVWQAHLLDKALVGTYGWREDRAQGWQRSLNTNSRNNEDNIPQTHQWGHLNWDAYYLPRAGSDLTEKSTSWSLVAHLDRLPFIGTHTSRLPVSVSLFYSQSENFQPEALRVDIYGEQIPLPMGQTRDAGFLIETRDGRYSLRVNNFKTEVMNATSSALNRAGFLGTLNARGGNWANQFEYDFGTGNQPANHHIGAQVNNRPAGAPQPPGWQAQNRPGNPDWDPTNTLYNYGQDVGETPEQASAREAAAVAAWRQWQNSVDPRFYAAWNIDLSAPFRQNNPTGLNSSTPNGFAITEDATSKGWEIELAAEPLRNWRVALNAAKISAVRSNIGGTNLANFIAGFENALQNTAAGDIRIWWGGAGNSTALQQWYSGSEGLGGEWAARKLQEGTKVPELREWRVNLITNYDFTEGRLRGLSVGAGVRWQDEVVIGYRPLLTGPNQLSFDLSNPYMGPAETNYDFWVGYGRKLTSRIDWRIQLNVRNAFQGDELIPITTQPDGTPATYRIAPPQVWTVTNTFRF